MFGLDREDGGVLELNAVAKVDAVFRHCRFVWMLHMDVSLVLLDPGNGHLTDVDSTALVGHAVHFRSPRSPFTGLRKYVIFLQGRGVRRVTDFDVSGQQPADVVESYCHVGQEGDQGRFLQGGVALASLEDKTLHTTSEENYPYCPI
ncbi:hypothetical protein L798_06154 [Zootermopsis nevadensis]|uniref:Uncharacterized protein n=1 Tax=Zootermopsis nevadensis TaxID=136037 RepID=A0A067R858_ZOONE|nr:hypothetical protein L798_06154 [Zootermopsis nevadensis]